MGASTGVEFQADDEIAEPFDPERIDVVTRTPTVDLILSRIENRMIDLAPDYQRTAGIWNLRNQSRLIESILLRIPLPTFYAAEGEDDVWSIVDGIQRLTTIARFVDPESIGMERLALTGLEYLSMYDGLTFGELPSRLQLRMRETEVVVHLIRRGTPEAVKFNIFARINTGGLPLSRQELRHALIPGSSRVLLRDLAESSEFQVATGGTVRAERMDDREMVLRFIAFLRADLAKYSHRDLDLFLRDATAAVNKLSDEEQSRIRNIFARAMRASYEIFGEHAFRKQFHEFSRRLPVNKALFEAVAVNLARRSEREVSELVDRKDQVNTWLKDLMDDPEFFDAISVATGDPRRVRCRFAAIDRLFGEVSHA